MPDITGQPTPEEMAQMGALASAQPVAAPTPEQAPVGTPMSPADLERERALLEQRNAPAETPAGVPTPSPVSEPQTAGPGQYVSEGARAGNPFAVVGNLPGGTSTTTATTNLGQPGKAAAAASDKATGAASSAVSKLTSVEEQRAAARAEQAGANVKIANQYAAQEALNVQAATERNNKALFDLRKSQDDYDKASKELGPNHFWQQQSTGQKIGNLIAMALSGLGQVMMAKGGVANTRNGALDMINLAIDRDIDMQKTALQAKERGVRVKESAYMMARQAGADEAQATALAKASAYQQTAVAFEAKVAATGDAEAKARGEQFQAQLMQARAQELQRVAEIQATRTQSTTTSTPITAMQLQGMAAQQNGLVPKDPKLATPYGQARDAESAREIAKAHLAFKTVDNAMTRLDVLRKKGGATGNWTPADKATFASLRTDLLTFAKGKYGADLGVLAGPDMEVLDPQIPNNNAWDAFSGRTDAVLKLMKERIDGAKDSIREGYTVRTHL